MSTSATFLYSSDTSYSRRFWWALNPEGNDAAVLLIALFVHESPAGSVLKEPDGAARSVPYCWTIRARDMCKRAAPSKTVGPS
jgi:hypothetical protein